MTTWIQTIGVLASVVLVVSACAGGEDATQLAEHGLTRQDDGSFLLRSLPFEVPAGEETFICYAHTLTHDVVLGSMAYTAKPVIHHLLLAKATAPEPEGLSACNVLFKTTWMPLFGAGSGDASVTVPPGAGHKLRAGTQILLQLHLLNPNQKDTVDVAEITIEAAVGEDARSVGLVPFGQPTLTLPPRSKSTVTQTCTMVERAEIFAALPHMHYLGKSY